MKILYLHGLESKLSDNKRQVLENFGQVTAPDMDYYNNPKIFEELTLLQNKHNFDVVIGSSMGGFMSYYFANTLKCPALLFNPALQQTKVVQNIPALNPTNASPLMHFALGGLDDVVSANDTLKWLSENRAATTDYKISLHKDLKHQIKYDIFKSEIEEFFRQLNLRP